MSFEPIKFAFTPPPTVLEQLPPAAAGAPAGAAEGTPGPAQSRAVSLASQFADLVETSNYLQSIVHSLNPGLGVTVEPAVHPELAAALSQIYSGRIPPAVSLRMYDYNLDAELGAGQVNQALGLNSTVEANPLALQASMTINRAVESELAGSGDFSAQTGLLLRALKTDSLVHQNIQSQLLAYPVTRVASTSVRIDLNQLPVATTDVGDEVTDALQTHIDKAQQSYAAVFQVLSGVDGIASDVVGAVTMLETVAIPDLMRIRALVSLAKGLTVQKALKGLSGGLVGVVYAMMVSEASALMFQMDRIIQIALNPATRMLNAVGSTLNSVTAAVSSVSELEGVIRSMKKAPTTQTAGCLAGMPLNNSSMSSEHLANGQKPPRVLSELGLTKAQREIGSLLHFCNTATNKANGQFQESFQKMTARLRKNTGCMAKVLAASSSMGSLTGLVDSFINEQQTGPAVAGQAPAAQLETVSRILASSQTGNGLNYTVQNGTVTVNPPAIPSPTEGARRVFAASGIKTTLTGLTQRLDSPHGS